MVGNEWEQNMKSKADYTKTARIIEIEKQWGELIVQRYIILDERIFESDESGDWNSDMSKMADKDIHFTFEAAKDKAYKTNYTHYVYKGRRGKFREIRDPKKMRSEMLAVFTY